jgi:uncharacterized protein
MTHDLERTCFNRLREGDLASLASVGERLCEVRPYGQPLVIHAVQEKRPEVLDLLLDRGCSPDARADDGSTALHAAAYQQDAWASWVLLEAGAAVDAEDQWGNTPLFRAVFSNHDAVEVIKLLLSYGADPSHENKSGVSPRSFAEKSGKQDIVELFQKGGGQRPADYS